MSQKKRESIAAILLLLALATFLFIGGRILKPKQADFGSNWGPFLQEAEDSIDIMFFGSSLAYCDIVPAIIWENSGYSAYVLAGGEQPLAVTYYYLREALRHQSPQAVFVEISGLFYSQDTDYLKANIGNMPLTANRLHATFEAAPVSEWPALFLPFCAYHDRWDELTREDFRYALLGYEPDPLAGYTFLSTSTPTMGRVTREIDFEQENYEHNLSYLQQIADYATEHDVAVIFYIAPSYWLPEKKYLDLAAADARAIDNAIFYDMNDDFAALGIDDSIDFFDILHFNYRGAEKFSTYLGHLICTLELDTPTADTQLWQSRSEYFHQLAAEADAASANLSQ